MNPFYQDNLDVTFTDHVKKQIANLEKGRAIQLDTANRKMNTIRVVIGRCAESFGFRVKTKTDINGNLWIKRVK